MTNHEQRISEALTEVIHTFDLGQADSDTVMLWKRMINEGEATQSDFEEIEMFLIQKGVL